MLKSNLASLIAIAAGAFAVDDVPRPRNRNVRTVKVRPKNYTHPMVTSSDDEIAAHNDMIELKKKERRQRRDVEARQFGTAGVLGFVPAKHYKSSKVSAYLRRAHRHATYGVGVAV